MTEHAILNNIDHADLGYDKTDLTHSELHKMCFSILVEEIDTLQCEYPIFFLKSEESLNPVVLCGFSQNENLFIQKAQWKSSFRPVYSKKGPFFISFNPDSGKASIAVDLTDGRVSNDITPKVFTEKGGNSPVLTEVKGILEYIGQGAPRTKAFTQLLEKHELLEPCQLEVNFTRDNSSSVNGLYTINQDVLSSLSDEIILDLYKNGAMKKIHFIIGSASNVRKLIDMRSNEQG